MLESDRVEKEEHHCGEWLTYLQPWMLVNQRKREEEKREKVLTEREVRRRPCATTHDAGAQ